MITVSAPQRTDPKLRPKPRPELWVVESPGVDPSSGDVDVDVKPRKRSSSGLVGTLTIVLLFVGIFGVVVFQVFLVQTQSHLDDLGHRVAEEDTRTKALRLEVAGLESPDRIVQDARNRLGMIKPPEVAYLQPSADDDRIAAYDAAKEAPPTTLGAVGTAGAPGTAGASTPSPSASAGAPPKPSTTPSTTPPAKPSTTPSTWAAPPTTWKWTPPSTAKPVTPTTARPSTPATTAKPSTPTTTRSVTPSTVKPVTTTRPSTPTTVKKSR